MMSTAKRLPPKHLIMGTAGHVDHGKTSLIKALTNIDCDTHKEEKQRGITINLGFSHFELPSGDSLGIIDVPGHKDFVHTMVGGASGIDFVLMVIAANSGIMPQTREHLNIMRTLGIKRGLIALTKVDMIEDDELLDLIKTEVMEFVDGTFLEDVPVVEVSSTLGTGIDTLIGEITNIAANTEERPAEGVFRMFVDRIFSVSGFGTVVTGSVGSGRLSVGDTAYLLPRAKKELRVRHLQRHGEDISEVRAGDRAAINLVGLERADFKRGMIISDRQLDGKYMVDAKLVLFNPESTLGLWSQVIFHCGTYESTVRIHLIDTNSVSTGDEVLVQIHLKEPCILRHGDRFIIRNTSSDTTLGGGIIINASPLHHRRRPEKLIKSMKSIAEGEPLELIAATVRKLRQAVYIDEVAAYLNVSESEIEAALTKKLPSDIIKYAGKNTLILSTKDSQDNIRKDILKSINEFRAKNPLLPKGISFDEIRSSQQIAAHSAAEEALRITLNSQTAKGKLKEIEKTWLLAGDIVEVSDQLEGTINAIETYMLNCGMKTPLMSEMQEITQRGKMSDKELRQILSHLTLTKKAYKIEDEYLHASIVDSCREKLIQELSGNTRGLTIADFRNLTGGNRKICLLLMAQFDKEQTTKRVGDVRLLCK